MGTLPTAFAPAERQLADQIPRERQRVGGGALAEIIDACPTAAAVLNAQRQIVFCNRALIGVTDGLDEQAVWGARPGEALGCQHARTTAGGCGTTEFCRTCGAVLAILEGQRGTPSTRDCHMTRSCGGRVEPLDLRVTVSPLPVWDRFVVCAIEDVGHETRRRALERVFFHDVLNSALALEVCAQALASAGAWQCTRNALADICRAARRLAAEIDDQRRLLLAESDDLALNPKQTTTGSVTTDVIEEFRLHRLAAHKRVVVGATADDVPFRIDTALLGRVLTNMIKNALEASGPGETVTLCCRAVPPNVEFSVHNEGVIPHEVQMQIFQRSFSTKGKGRGLGTYSMKLFTDRYLNGEVWFESAAETGTTFFLRVPAACERSPTAGSPDRAESAEPETARR